MPHPCCRLQSAASRSAPSAGAPGIQRPKVFHLNVLPQLSQPAGEAPTTSTFQGESEANWPWPPQKFTVLRVTSLRRNIAKHGETGPKKKELKRHSRSGPGVYSETSLPWNLGVGWFLGHHVSSSRWNLRQHFGACSQGLICPKSCHHTPKKSSVRSRNKCSHRPCPLCFPAGGWLVPQLADEIQLILTGLFRLRNPRDGQYGLATAVWTTMVCFLEWLLGTTMVCFLEWLLAIKCRRESK